MHADFQDFLYHIVEDEDAEDDFTAHNEEVPVIHVADQLNRADLPGRDGPSCGWELYHQSVRKARELVGTGLRQLPPFPGSSHPAQGTWWGKVSSTSDESGTMVRECSVERALTSEYRRD